MNCNEKKNKQCALCVETRERRNSGQKVAVREEKNKKTKKKKRNDTAMFHIIKKRPINLLGKPICRSRL
ncbi:hypothetical protein WN55_00063 [Dufourea novaeangliae]|uniref:Uncharacterized protein n=1 Tax=Dufourea novaeangliae TaxID=178035 RepID=A0A154NXR3_DUFNO|nr:hypothetical protein WN55_00063 [Dufourea novaeangliae]